MNEGMPNNLFRHISLLALLPMLPLLLCGLLSSCDRSTEEAVLWPEGGIPVEFRIRVESGAQSRAPLPGEDGTLDKGSGRENYIDIADLHFFLFATAEDTYIDQFSPNELIPIDTTGDPTDSDPVEWIVRGVLPEGFETRTSFRIVVLANWGEAYTGLSPTERTGIADVCRSGIYAYTPFSSLDNLKIPMYGVRTCTGVTFRADLMTDLGQIDVLRAMAKVEVSCEEHLVLSDVKLTYYNNKGYCAPLDIYDNTKYAEDVHIPTTAVQNSEGLSFIPQEDGSWVIYVPEYENVLNGNPVDSRAQISITLQEGDTTIGGYVIDFKNYSDDSAEKEKHFDIIRNYYYRFYIRSVTSTPEIYYTVCPWNQKKTSIELN